VVLPSLSVTTSTQGVELDPDGYSLLIDQSQSQAVGVAATLVVDRLPDGDHTLELAGLASNCSAQGENPRTITVKSGTTTNTAFAVLCSATSGSIEVATSTSGSGTDTDGFALVIDGAERGPIGTSGTVSLSGITPGAHSLGLTGLAGNCQVVGENPRAVTVVAGQTAQVPFSVTCVAPGTATGTLDITTSTSGSDQDADGYSVSLDGGAIQPIGASARLTLTNIPSSPHRVELLGVAPNCAVSGANPRNVTVTAGQTTTVAFAVTCTPRPAETGNVRVTVSTSGGSPDGDGYTVSVDGGSAQDLNANGSRTIQGLTAGAHSVQLGGVAANCTVTGDNPQPVTVVTGQTATVTFAVSCVATGPSVNLRIEGMYLTQSTQRLAGDVPLIQGRDGYIRVFVVANASNSVRPSVRVRFFQNGASSPVQTLTISSEANSTPTALQEGTLGSSWNIRVPGALMQPNTTVLADVDPDNAVSETNETDNTFPTSGTPRPMNVRAVPPMSIRFVPIRQAANGLQGAIGNAATLVDLARRIYPLNEVRTADHPVYTTSTQLPLQSLNGNFAWDTVLAELDVLRITEGTNSNYFGLVRLDYGAGLNGIGYVGVPTAIGSDDPADVSHVVAHELGHNWGRWHSPCGSPGGLDPNEPYPYPGGRIGVYGLDVRNERLKPPSDPDIMGYCANPWISDHTYRKVLTFRDANSFGTGMLLGERQPSLIIWGRVENGRPILEPAFQVITRASLPNRPGPYSIEATASDGTRLFSLSFEAAQVADRPDGSRHFAFAVPLDPVRAARLGSLRLTGPGAQVAAISQAAAQLRRGPTTDTVSLQREAGAVTLKWNALVHPMIMVRDPDTGEVLSFARGGNARVWTDKDEVDLEVSSGVGSQRVRRAISR
jgi:hypothetical protein